MSPTPTLRQLEYLVQLAELRSFRRAARACHVTQPGLSTQIRALEHLLDLRLFERDRRRVLVTPAGEALAERARRVLGEVQGLVEAARGLQRPLAGALRLGVIPTVAPYLLPRVLPRVRRLYPELRLRLHEARTAELVALLARGELDLLLLALEAPLPGLATHALWSDPFVLATPRGHRLAGRRRVREQDLAGEKVLLLEDGHCLRTQALAVCRAGGAEELHDFRASSLTTLVEMVSDGAGVTLLPELALGVEARRADLALVRFAAPEPQRTIGLAWRPSSGRAGEYEQLGAALVPPRGAKGKGAGGAKGRGAKGRGAKAAGAKPASAKAGGAKAAGARPARPKSRAR